MVDFRRQLGTAEPEALIRYKFTCGENQVAPVSGCSGSIAAVDCGAVRFS